VENEAVQTDRGEHEVGEGAAYPEANVTFSTYAEGAGQDSEDPANNGYPVSQAQPNAFIELAAAALGGIPSQSTGDVCATAPTTTHTPTQITQATPGNHRLREFVAIDDADQPGILYATGITDQGAGGSAGDAVLHCVFP